MIGLLVLWQCLAFMFRLNMSEELILTGLEDDDTSKVVLESAHAMAEAASVTMAATASGAPQVDSSRRSMPRRSP